MRKLLKHAVSKWPSACVCIQQSCSYGICNSILKSWWL